ncbi:MAG: hypothetical protein R3E47_14420 [Paracoccaceae bacterium]
MTETDRWRLAALYLLMTAPFCMAVAFEAVPLPETGLKLVFYGAPILAAAINGMVLRRRLGHFPKWRERHPYSRAMAWLLFLFVFLVIMLLPYGMVVQRNWADGFWSIVITTITGFFKDALLLGLLSLAALFLMSLAQAEIGLLAGSWIADRIVRRRGSAE